MEKRLHKKIDLYNRNFKNDICVEISKNPLFDSNSEELTKIINYVYEYNSFELNKDDFMKRKRVKSNIPVFERCCAKRASGQQCTRRKKDGLQYCGTHSKGTPHGIMTDSEPSNNILKVEVSVIEIQGIAYYLDNNNNVYDTEDILSGKNNPRVITKYSKNGDKYSIPEFNI
tara:strand:- start:26 stop:541 length:516 start_codon:yes stop_codon:yes gene_type:complete